MQACGRCIVVFAAVMLIAMTPSAGDAEAQSRHAVVVGGLGGSAEQTARFDRFLRDTRRALVERLGFSADNVVVLGERAIADNDHVDGVSMAEDVRQALADVALRASSADDVYLIFFGHGSSDGEQAHVNIPRRDLSDADYAELLGAVEARRIVVVNTASASAPFATSLAGEDRVIATATRVASQRNATTFPEYFVEALANPAADRDRDGRLSLLEVFTYAGEKTDQSFADAGNLATENALLEDNGDGVGTRLPQVLAAAGAGGVDGALAATTWLSSRSGEAAALAASLPDSVAASVSSDMSRRDALYDAIAELKAEKAQTPDENYWANLEELFVELARLEARLDDVGQ